MAATSLKWLWSFTLYDKVQQLVLTTMAESIDWVYDSRQACWLTIQLRLAFFSRTGLPIPPLCWTNPVATLLNEASWSFLNVVFFMALTTIAGLITLAGFRKCRCLTGSGFSSWVSADDGSIRLACCMGLTVSLPNPACASMQLLPLAGLSVPAKWVWSYKVRVAALQQREGYEHSGVSHTSWLKKFQACEDTFNDREVQTGGPDVERLLEHQTLRLFRNKQAPLGYLHLQQGRTILVRLWWWKRHILRPLLILRADQQTLGLMKVTA